MVLKIPQNHNFSDSLIKKVFEETGCQSLPDWEISVRRTDDIAWSVVLSYLMSTNYHKEQNKQEDKNHEDQTQDDFARRLERLTGSDKNLKSVKKSIRSFNPFRNRSSCFYDETLRQVVKEFKRNFSWDSLYSVRDKLLAVSTTLRCPIVLIWRDENNPKSRIYSKNTEKCEEIIALYSSDISEENEKTETVHNDFLLNHQLGLKMKKAALFYFLKEAKMSKKEIRRIKLAVENDKHFLISLLTNDCQEIIRKLYKSAYVVSKLAEAGFETDPRTKDTEGFSALYHALVLGDVKTLYVLYYFAANNCFQSEGSFRNPDSCILNNLLQMEEILKADFAKSEDFRHHPDRNDLKRTSDDLLRLNRFLIEVNNKIIKIKNKLNYYESTNETVFEACKRRDIVVSVLDTYQEFFKPVQQESANLSPLDDYVMFENYYSLIDMATAIIFFDNIIFLKERLLLADETQFSEMESSFFLSVLYHVEFDEENIANNFFHPSIQINMNGSYIFPLIRRLENMNKIKEFRKNLQDTIINEDNVVNCIPMNEIYGIFKSYASIKDGFDLERLKKYIETALKVKVTDVKSVLIIERVLQVIGEYITLEDIDDYSFKRFLSLILPKEVSRSLRHTRNQLSHVKNYVFMPKAECETNFSLFRSIQGEIRTIQRYLKPVFQTQKLSGSLFRIKLFEEQLEQIKELVHSYDSSLDAFYLREVSTFLIMVRRVLIRSHRSSCKEMLKTVIHSVEEDILKEINWLGDLENLKNKILYALWPIKWLLELLQQCGEVEAATVLDVFETLKNCSQNIDEINYLRDKTSNFLSKCKDLLSPSIRPCQKKVIKPLKLNGNIEHFLKILKGFVYLSNEEKEEIRKEIPETIKQSITFKENLVKSIHEGFSLNVYDKDPEFKISYLSNKKMTKLKKFYRSKNPEALDILKTPDPITELEEIFSKSSVDKGKYESLCKTMQFSNQTQKKLGRLVAGQRKKIPGNNLSNLLNRVQLLKKILIEENEKIFYLWLKVKRQTSRQYVVDTIVWYYLRDRELQAAVEMLLFDCMSVYENEKRIEKSWIKSSKFYCGINLRNVISHGSPLLESLCKLLDPEDLPSDLIKKILQLIEDEDAIEAILELYHRTNNDFPRLQAILNSKKNDDYFDLKKRIWKCDEWKNYILLLPYNPIPSEN